MCVGKTHTSRVTLNIRHMQLVGEEEVDPNDLYSIPEHMRHNRTLSRVFDTPKGQIVGYSNNSSITAWNRRVSDHVAGTGNHLQVPQSPLDALPASRSEGPTVPEASSDTMITNQSHKCLHVSQSVPDAVSATQELVALSRPIQTQHRMELSRSWVRHLKKRAAPDWKVSVDGKHVHCQCRFNEGEGDMVRVRESLRVVFFADPEHPSRCSAATATTGSTSIVTAIFRRC